jgi:hypothetical protein
MGASSFYLSMKKILMCPVSCLLVLSILGDPVTASISVNLPRNPVSHAGRLQEEALALEAIPYLSRHLHQIPHHAGRLAIWMTSMERARVMKTAVVLTPVGIVSAYVGDVIVKGIADYRATSVSVASTGHHVIPHSYLPWGAAAAGFVALFATLAREGRWERVKERVGAFVRKHFPPDSGGTYNQNRERMKRILNNKLMFPVWSHVFPVAMTRRPGFIHYVVPLLELPLLPGFCFLLVPYVGWAGAVVLGAMIIASLHGPQTFEDFLVRTLGAGLIFSVAVWPFISLIPNSYPHVTLASFLSPYLLRDWAWAVSAGYVAHVPWNRWMRAPHRLALVSSELTKSVLRGFASAVVLADESGILALQQVFKEYTVVQRANFLHALNKAIAEVSDERYRSARSSAHQVVHWPRVMLGPHGNLLIRGVELNRSA